MGRFEGVLGFGVLGVWGVWRVWGFRVLGVLGLGLRGRRPKFVSRRAGDLNTPTTSCETPKLYSEAEQPLNPERCMQAGCRQPGRGKEVDAGVVGLVQCQRGSTTKLTAPGTLLNPKTLNPKSLNP